MVGREGLEPSIPSLKDWCRTYLATDPQTSTLRSKSPCQRQEREDSVHVPGGDLDHTGVCIWWGWEDSNLRKVFRHLIYSQAPLPLGDIPITTLRRCYSVVKELVGSLTGFEPAIA